MPIRRFLVVLACLCAGAAYAQSAKTTAPQQKSPTLKSNGLSKQSTPTDDFSLKTTDSGDSVQNKLEFDLPNDKNTYIFGKKTTTYAIPRSPGELNTPDLPGQSTQSHFSIGIGKRF